MGEYIHKSHNVNVLLYHYVCPAKYRKVIFGSEVDRVLVQTCKEISERYDFEVIESGADVDHVHFLIQASPTLAPKNYCADPEEYHSEADIQTMSIRKTQALGRRVVERRIFREHSRTTR